MVNGDILAIGPSNGFTKENAQHDAFLCSGVNCWPEWCLVHVLGFVKVSCSPPSTIFTTPACPLKRSTRVGFMLGCPTSER